MRAATLRENAETFCLLPPSALRIAGLGLLALEALALEALLLGAPRDRCLMDAPLWHRDLGPAYFSETSEGCSRLYRR